MVAGRGPLQRHRRPGSAAHPAEEERAPVLQLVSGVAAAGPLVAGPDRHRPGGDGREHGISHTRPAGGSGLVGRCQTLPSLAMSCAPYDTDCPGWRASPPARAGRHDDAFTPPEAAFGAGLARWSPYGTRPRATLSSSASPKTEAPPALWENSSRGSNRAGA